MNTVIASILPAPEAKGNTLLPINAVERETGISKELLRMWERRYHFPNPEREAKVTAFILRIKSLNYALFVVIRCRFSAGKIIGLDLLDFSNASTFTV